jgi:hypothetical protein
LLRVVGQDDRAGVRRLGTIPRVGVERAVVEVANLEFDGPVSGVVNVPGVAIHAEVRFMLLAPCVDQTIGVVLPEGVAHRVPESSGLVPLPLIERVRTREHPPGGRVVGVHVGFAKRGDARL